MKIWNSACFPACNVIPMNGTAPINQGYCGTDHQPLQDQHVCCREAYKKPYGNKSGCFPCRDCQPAYRYCCIPDAPSGIHTEPETFICLNKYSVVQCRQQVCLDIPYLRGIFVDTAKNVLQVAGIDLQNRLLTTSLGKSSPQCGYMGDLTGQPPASVQRFRPSSVSHAALPKCCTRYSHG